MRTTLELPDALMRQAKMAAVERGTTLRELVGKALARELGIVEAAKPKRAEFPLFPAKTLGSLTVSAKDLAKLDAEEDKRQRGLAR